MGVRLYGTSYFNLQFDSEYMKLLNKYFKIYGINNPISRLSDFDNFKILESCEAIIAEDFGCEASALFSSGYLASICIKNYMQFIAKRHQKDIFHLSSIHPAWIDAQMKEIKYSYENSDELIISNSLNSFYGIKENYMNYIQKCRKIAVDVSHSAYIWDHKSEADKKILFFGSLNKAAAFPAGFIAGTKDDIEKIKNTSEYTASTPPSIAFAKAFMELSYKREELLVILKEYMSRLNFLLKRDCKNSFPIYNLGVNSEVVYKKFKKNGFDLSYMPYPYKDSDKHLRIVLHSGVTDQEFTKLIEFIQNTFKSNLSNLDLL